MHRIVTALAARPPPSQERRAPVFEYLHALGVAEQGLEAQLTATASRAGKTSAADWLQRGATFFEEKLWPLAEMSYLRGGDKALALRAGAARLFAEARAAAAAAEARAASAKYRLAALALLQSAATRGDAAGAAVFARAALALLSAAQALEEAREPAARSGLYEEAGHVVWRGLGRPREAAWCFTLAASEQPRAAAQQWQHATHAMRAAADFGGKGRALEALRRMAAGRMGEDKGDAEAIAQVTGDAATLRAVLHGLAKEG